MKNYAQRKAEAREKAIDYQHKIMTADDLYYSEIAYYCDKLYKIAKRYGLVKEFRENGIC